MATDRLRASASIIDVVVCALAEARIGESFN